MRRTPLLPPMTPVVPHGLQRGGVFDATWVPPTFVDAQRQTIPTNSPPGHDVAQDIFRQQIAFAPPDRSRRITGAMGAMPHIQRAGVAPVPIRPYHTVPIPGGTEAGGIFGTGPAPMIAYPNVPQRRPLPPMLAGFGSPDGLGGCGCGGCIGGNC